MSVLALEPNEQLDKDALQSLITQIGFVKLVNLDFRGPKEFEKRYGYFIGNLMPINTDSNSETVTKQVPLGHVM
jgi:hypothetical protein